MKSSLFTYMFLILSIFAFSNEDENLDKKFNVSGVVVFAESQEPVDNATIIIEIGTKQNYVITDENGRFKLANVPMGELSLEVSQMNCERTFMIDVQSEIQNDVRLEMENCAEVLDPITIINPQERTSKSESGTATVIPMKRLELSNPMGTQELLKDAPGVHGFSDDGAGNSRLSIGIRGLNPRRSSRVLILEDGIPIQPALYVYPNMYYNPPVERISTVEVIKGSGAIQYGPQTMGGVINYITRKPRKDFGGMIHLSGGNNGYLSTYAEIGGFGNQKITPEIQLLYKRGDGFRENNAFSQINATAKLVYNTNETTDWYIKFNVNQENSQATYTGLTEYSFLTNPYFNPKENDEFDIFRVALDAIRTKRINENITGVTKLYGNYFRRDWWRENDIFVQAENYNSTGALDAVPWYTEGDLIRVGNGRDNFGILRSFYVTGAEQTFFIDHEGLFKGRLIAGGRLHMERFIDDKRQGFSIDDRVGKYFVIKGVDEEWDTWNEWTGTTDSIAILGQAHTYETSSLSAYLNEEIKLGKFIVKPGVRAEVFEQVRIDRLNGAKYQDKMTYVVLPGLGFNYEFKSSNLFGGIHRGFTPPSSGALKVLNFGSTDGLNLEAEKSWNMELGYRGTLKALRWEVALFNLEIEDMVAAGRGTVFKNLGKVNTRGIEFTAKFEGDLVEKEIKKWLITPFITYTYLETEIKEGTIASSQVTGDISVAGNSLPYAPTHSLTFGVEKELFSSLTLSTEIRYISAVYTDFENITKIENRGDQGQVPGFTLINVNTLYHIDNNWTAFVSAKNITNEVYIGSRLHSNPGQPQAHLSSGIMPGAARQINFGIKYQFEK